MRSPFLLLFAVAAMLATPAMAQRAAAARAEREEREGLAPGTNPDAVLWTYTSCLVRSNTIGAERVLAQLPRSAASTQLLEKMQVPSCLTSIMRTSYQLRFDPALIRGFMAEHLLLRDFDRDTGKMIKQRPVYDASPDNLADESGDTRADVALIESFECAIASDPISAGTILKTRPATHEEKRAVKAFAPRLSGCLDSDVAISFSPSMVRGLLAEAAYRASHKQAHAVLIRVAS